MAKAIRLTIHNANSTVAEIRNNFHPVSVDNQPTLTIKDAVTNGKTTICNNPMNASPTHLIHWIASPKNNPQIKPSNNGIKILVVNPSGLRCLPLSSIKYLPFEELSTHSDDKLLATTSNADYFWVSSTVQMAATLRCFLIWKSMFRFYQDTQTWNIS